jgi:hypothetical protein
MKNIGWCCTHCPFELFGKSGRNVNGLSVAERVMKHIKEKHPLRWQTGNWAITPIPKGSRITNHNGKFLR